MKSKEEKASKSMRLVAVAICGAILWRCGAPSPCTKSLPPPPHKGIRVTCVDDRLNEPRPFPNVVIHPQEIKLTADSNGDVYIDTAQFKMPISFTASYIGYENVDYTIDSIPINNCIEIRLEWKANIVNFDTIDTVKYHLVTDTLYPISESRYWKVSHDTVSKD